MAFARNWNDIKSAAGFLSAPVKAGSADSMTSFASGLCLVAALTNAQALNERKAVPCDLAEQLQGKSMRNHPAIVIVGALAWSGYKSYQSGSTVEIGDRQPFGPA